MTKLIDELTPGDATDEPETKAPEGRLTWRPLSTRSQRTSASSSLSHENPDGDALGSLLGMSLGLRALGKDVVMYLSGTGRCRPSSVPVFEGASRELPDVVGERVCSPSIARTRAGSARTRRSSISPKTVVDVDHHHDNTRFGVGEPDRRRRVVDRGDRSRPALGARRAAHAGDRRGALRRPRHRHRPLPVLEHDAEVVPPRGRAGRGGRRRARHLPQRLRDGAVREAEAARARPRPGAACTRAGGCCFVLASGPTSTRSAPRSRTRRASSTTCARRRATQMVALIREPPGDGRTDPAHLPPVEQGRGRRLGRGTQGGRGRPPAGRRILQRAADRARSPSSSERGSWPHAARRGLADAAAGQ